jgi:AAA-like domain
MKVNYAASLSKKFLIELLNKMLKNVEELFEFSLQLVAIKTRFSLSYIHKVILRESLVENKKTYAKIAEDNKYSESYIKFTVAPKVWKLLSQALGEKVNKTNLPALLEQQFINQNNPQPTKTITAMSPVVIFPTKRHFLESPEGQVPLASGLYVERSTIEQTCYQEILQPRAFIRIKAPGKMGKTSLIARILDYGRSQNFHTVRLSLHRAGTQVLASTERFLRWFCTNVTQHNEFCRV